VQRLRRLGPAAEALARAVAILGEEPDPELAAALAGLELEAAAASAAELARSDVLRPRGPLAFAHPVLRAAVYADLGEAERERGHEQAAELLGESGATAQRVAAHLLHVQPRARASVVATLREAAHQASDEGAADVASRISSARWWSPLTRTNGRTSCSSSARPSCAPACPARSVTCGRRTSSRGGNRPPRKLRSRSLMRTSPKTSICSEAADALQRTIEGIDPSDAALTQRLEAELIMWARFDSRLYPTARERLARIADRAAEDSLGGRFLMVLVASELARAGESPDRARELVQRALAGGLLLRGESWQGYVVAVAVLLSLDELDTAVRLYTEFLELARSQGSAYAFAHASAFRAFELLRCGDLPESEADGRAALDGTVPLGFTYVNLAEALAERGELTEAIRTLDLAGEPEDPHTWQTASLLAPRAWLRIANGDVTPGLADLLAAGETIGSFGMHNPSYSAWRSQAALTMAGLCDRQDARRLVAEEITSTASSKFERGPSFEEQWQSRQAEASEANSNGRVSREAVVLDDTAQAGLPERHRPS
jgi:tetratricopeptide (TPR) repeat protein